MTWSIAAPAVTAAFLASLVEVVEAFTIVLAVATLRGWRPAALGTAGGLAVLAGIVLLLTAIFRNADHGGGPLLWVALALFAATIGCWFASSRAES